MCRLILETNEVNYFNYFLKVKFFILFYLNYYLEVLRNVGIERF